MTRHFDVVVERDTDGYFVASVPAISGCHTQARSLDELMERVRGAIELCLAAQKRLKLPGAWWLAANADHMLALRINRFNKRWCQYWASHDKLAA